MAKFSVWNIATSMFDYYENGDIPTRTNVDKPTHLKARTLGATVEQACWPLPSDARRVGSGPHAIGKVAIQPSAALGASSTSDLPIAKGILLACAGALAVKFLLPGRRRR